jgi:putative transposase
MSAYPTSNVLPEGSINPGPARLRGTIRYDHSSPTTSRNRSIRCFPARACAFSAPDTSTQGKHLFERFVKTGQHECLDHVLAFGEHHLERILREYISHYNKERPHRGLSLETPEPELTSNRAGGEIVRVSRLGGLISEYHRIAA